MRQTADARKEVREAPIVDEVTPLDRLPLIGSAVIWLRTVAAFSAVTVPEAGQHDRHVLSLDGCRDDGCQGVGAAAIGE